MPAKYQPPLYFLYWGLIPGSPHAKRVNYMVLCAQAPKIPFLSPTPARNHQLQDFRCADQAVRDCEVSLEETVVGMGQLWATELDF